MGSNPIPSAIELLNIFNIMRLILLFVLLWFNTVSANTVDYNCLELKKIVKYPLIHQFYYFTPHTDECLSNLEKNIKDISQSISFHNYIVYVFDSEEVLNWHLQCLVDTNNDETKCMKSNKPTKSHFVAIYFNDGEFIKNPYKILYTN